MNLLPYWALTARNHRPSAAWMVRLFLSLLGLVAASSVSLAATILTDKADYAPAETALITGEGWLPGETVRLEIDHITGGGPFGDGHDPWEVIADESGKVTTTWFVNPDDSLGATFLMTADGLTSGRRAEWTFTDGRTIASVRLNGGTSATVPPGSTITAVVTVNGFNGGGPSNWESTGWRISSTPPGALTVIDHADRTGAGTWSETFIIRAPTQPGSYNAYFIAYANDTGSGGSAQPSALYTLAASVTVASALSLSESHVDVTCHGAGNGSIDLSVSGGTAPYSYLWSNGATSQDLSGLTPGTYSVTVTDANNLTASKSVAITQPPALVATSSATTIQCYGGTATVTVSATGGTAPYTEVGTFTVGAGTYSYTVTDANGCTASTSITVTQPPALVATSSATTIQCYGGTATVTVSATGGTAPYTGAGTFTVGAGTHNYTVTDARGCTATTSVTVSQPTLLVASSSATPILTPGGTSTVTVTATGGVAPYSGTGEFTVGAGTHSYTVTDANGCSSATTVTVAAPDQLIAFVSQNRTVASSASASAASGGDEVEQSDAAVEFEPFLSLADSSIELPLETGPALGQGAALQDSILGFATINASGEASLSLSLPLDPSAAAAAGAQSYFDVSFSLPNSGVVSFAGLVTTQVAASDGAAVPAAETQVRLIDSATSAVLAETLTGNEEFSFAGPLNAGTYQIVALATVSGDQAGSTTVEQTVSAQSTYSFAFEYAPGGEPGGGSGETYFVDYASGSDAADGLTIATAWKHVPGDPAATGVPAATVLARGDTIRFKGGVVYYGGFFVDRSGVAGDPIVYDGNHGGTWGSGRAILDGNYLTQPAITVSANVRNVDVLGFEIRNIGGYADDDPILSTTLADGAVSSPPGGIAISISKGGNVGIRLENLFIHRVGQWRNQEPFSGANSITGTGISVQNGDGLIIKDSEFTKMRNPISLKATTILQNVLVENCDLHEYFVWGIDVAPRASGAILRNIELRNNIVRDYHQYDLGNWLGGGEKPHSDGMFLRTARIVSTWDNIRIHGNLFYADDLGNSQGGTASIYLSQGPSALVYNNVFINDRHSRSIMVGGTAPTGNAKQVVRIMNNTLLRMSAIYSDDNLLDPSLKDLYITGNVIYRVSSVNNHVMVNRDSGVYFRELEGNCYFDPNFTVTQRYILIDRGYRKLNISPSVRELGFEVYGDYADPKFVNGTGLPSMMNLRVQSDSPARFMAPNQSEFFTTDKDGNPRPATGRWTAGAFQ